MPRIKKIPPKIKEIKPVDEQRDESDLEQEIEKTEAQKEVDNFVEFVTSATKEIVPVLEQGEIPRSPGTPNQTQTATSQRSGEEILQARETYGGTASAGNYSTSNSTGKRDRERNVYNPSLRQTSPLSSGGSQMTPAKLADRSIGGQKFIGQEEGIGRRDDGGERTTKKEYKSAHEGG